MNEIFLSLGSNLGDRRQNLETACGLLKLPVVHASSIYDTEPVGYLEQAWFYNVVIEVECDLSPSHLLQRCQDVENEMGRVRDIPKGPRVIDVDILFYSGRIIRMPDLVIPHPLIQERRFVLEPMNELAPGFKHPSLHKTISELWQECPDASLAIRRADLKLFSTETR